MKIIDIRDEILNISSKIKKENILKRIILPFEIEKKTTSLLHRIKNKENPNEELLSGLEKIFSNYTDIIISEELKNYCKNIDFNKIFKQGTGARGKDKKRKRNKKEKNKENEIEGEYAFYFDAF